MATKPPRNPATRRAREGRDEKTSVHITIEPALKSRLAAYAGWHNREIGDVVAEGLRHVLKGFSVRQDAPQTARPHSPGPPGPGDDGPGEDARSAVVSRP